MSVSVRQMPTQAPVDDVAWFFSKLWRGFDGWACICVGRNGTYNAKGAYVFAEFTQHFYRWPDARRDLYRYVVAQGQEHDVYAAVALRQRRSRVAEAALPSRYLWADIDQPWTARHDALWSTVATAGSFTIASGSGGHRHMYLRIDEPLARVELERLNERLARKFGGDSKHDAAAVLRIPGTTNRKGAAKGGAATVVSVAGIVVEDDRITEVAA